MIFAPDGSSIVLGTENGKVLVQDLRSMEKDHRTLLVGEEDKGESVVGLSVQVCGYLHEPSTLFIVVSRNAARARHPFHLL